MPIERKHATLIGGRPCYDLGLDGCCRTVFCDHADAGAVVGHLLSGARPFPGVRCTKVFPRNIGAASGAFAGLAIYDMVWLTCWYEAVPEPVDVRGGRGAALTPALASA